VPGSEERKWLWGQQEHAIPPVGLFVDAILRGWAGSDQETAPVPYAIPQYLTSYLTKKSDTGSGSCSTCG
jgi:hypothetical protein